MEEEATATPDQVATRLRMVALAQAVEARDTGTPVVTMAQEFYQFLTGN